MKRFWSSGEDELMRSHYPHEATKSVAVRLNRSLSSVYGRADLLGLNKSPEYLASPDAFRFRRGYHAGWEHRFKKGEQPWNAGRKGWQAGGRSAETQFKKGAKPWTWQPIGAERLSKEGYLQRKVTDTGYTPRDWVGVHILIWREAHGAVPRGHAVCFKDGDKTHIALDNLELVSRRTLMARNTVHRLPKEIAQVIQLTGALNRQIRKRAKHEKQNVGSSQSSIRDARSAQG